MSYYLHADWNVVSPVIFHWCFYTILIGYLRGKLYRIWYKSKLKYIESAIFLSVLSWMRTKRVSLKSMVWRGGYKKVFAGGGLWPSKRLWIKTCVHILSSSGRPPSFLS